MRLLYIVNGIGFASNVSLGGSDKRAMEIGRRLLNYGHEISVLTTSPAYNLLRDVFPARYFVISEPWFLRGKLKNGLLGRIFAYVYVGILCSFYPLKEKYDLVFPTSDFLFDILPAISYKLRKICRKLVSIVHHKINSPFKRRGEFLKDLVLFCLQRVSFLAMGIFSDSVFVYATKEGESIKRALRKFNVKDINVFSVICGIDIEKIKKVPEQEKKFTACFIGGLRPAKGLWDFVPIWQKVCSVDKTSRLLIIGSGVSLYVEQLSNLIQKYGLEENITLLAGHQEESKLYELLNSARLLILPSYEEGWSIIICEALSLGIPALAYDLDIFDMFSGAVQRVEVGNTDAFARKVLDIVSQKELYKNLVDKAWAISKKFDWDIAAKNEEELLLKIIR